MSLKRGFSTPLLLLVVTGSILLNIYLFRIILKNSSPVSKETNAVVVRTDYVQEIARAMGISTNSGRSEADIAMDIKLLLQEASVAPKMALADDSIVRMSKLLNSENREKLKAWQDFMKKLAGKRYIIVSEE